MNFKSMLFMCLPTKVSLFRKKILRETILSNNENMSQMTVFLNRYGRESEISILK